MRTIVKGKNMDVPDAVRRYAERKTRRLERFLDDRTEAIIELSVEHHKSADDSRIADVTLVIDGQTVRGRDGTLDRASRPAKSRRCRPILDGSGSRRLPRPADRPARTHPGGHP